MINSRLIVPQNPSLRKQRRVFLCSDMRMEAGTRSAGPMRRALPSLFPLRCVKTRHYRAQLPRKERLSFGVRVCVERSTAMSPKVIEKPFCHSKLSIRLQQQ